MRAALERHGGDLQETADELGCGRGYVATVRDRLAAAYRRLGTELPPYLVKKPGEITALRFRHVPRVAFSLATTAPRPPAPPVMPPAPVRPAEVNPAAIPAPKPKEPPRPVQTPAPKPSSKLEKALAKVRTRKAKAERKIERKLGRPRKTIQQEVKRKKAPAGFVWAANGALFPEDLPRLLRPYNLFVQTGGSLVESALQSGQGYPVLRRFREALVKELGKRGLPIPKEFRDGFKDDGPGLPSEADLNENRDMRVCPHSGQKCEYWRTCEFNHVFSNRADMCENNLGAVGQCTKCGRWQSDECEFKCFRKAFEERTGKRLAFGLDTSGRTSAKRSTGGVGAVASDPYAGIWR